MADTNETNLEKTFSGLAFSTLRDKAQALLDYLIGFQMIRQEKEGKRAVGIFGFEIDDKVYYAPVFFLNGEVRGLDAIYSTDSDLFMPLTEDWVNSVINKRQIDVGEPDKRSRNERGVRVPSYMRLKTVPSSHGAINMKIAMAKFASDMLITDEVGNQHIRFRETENDLVDAPTGLKLAGATKFFKEALAKDYKLQQAFEQFYNYADLQEPEVKVAAEAETKKEKPITIIRTVTDAGTDDLSDEDRKNILAGGVGVIDKRPEVKKSILYSTEAKERLATPTEGGLYDVLWSDGSVEPALIVQNGDSMSRVLVIRLSDGNHCEITPQKVYVVRQYNLSEYVNHVKEEGKLPSEVKVGDVVAFLSLDGNGTSGYCISERIDGLDGSTVLVPNDHYYMMVRGDQFAVSYPYGYGSADTRNRHGRQNPNDRVQKIVVTDRGGYEPRFTRDKLLVNDQHFRAIVLNRATFDKDPKYPTKSCIEEEYKDKKADVLLAVSDFGDYKTVMHHLQKVAAEVTVWKNDRFITVKDDAGVHDLDKVAALKHFMLGHGLGRDDAELIIKHASAEVETYYVKYASEFDQFPVFPPEDVDSSFGNEMNNNFPGQVPVSLKLPKTPEDNREFYSYQSPFGGGGHEGNGVSGGGGGGKKEQDDGDSLSKVQRAAQTGQKDVFDASVLGSLVKSHAPCELVDRFLPTIITGMDRLGRIIFLTHWHYDDFEERYGENDLSELLDNLRASFNDIGDIIMFLKKRTMAGDPDHYGVGKGQSDIEGEV